MNSFEKWVERIDSETDFGRSAATSISGVIGLVTYYRTADWVVAAYATIIAFPVFRMVLSSFHERISKAAERRERDAEIEQLFIALSPEEKAVVDAFVSTGGCVMTWGQVNKSDISRTGIESLIQRELIFTSMTADGMTETFVLDSHLYTVALRRNRAVHSNSLSALAAKREPINGG